MGSHFNCLTVVLDRNGDGLMVDYLNGAGIDDKLRQRSSTGAGAAHYFLQDHLSKLAKEVWQNANKKPEKPAYFVEQQNHFSKDFCSFT